MNPAQSLSRPLMCDVLEDDPAVSEVICGILRRSGASYRSFTNLADHILAMQGERPDVVFLDVKLGEADAIEAIRLYHDLNYRGYIQVVSGLDPQRLFEIYKMSDRYGYRALYPIGKPFRSRAITAVLDHVQDSLKRVAPATRAMPSGILSGWLSGVDDANQPAALLVQPTLLAASDETDALSDPSVLNATLATLTDALRTRQEPTDVWMVTRISTALSNPIRQIIQDATENQILAPRLMVPLSEVAADAKAFSDLQTRLAVYGLGLGVFADRLEDLSLSTLSTCGADTLLIGEGIVERSMVSASSRVLVERVLFACKSLGMTLAAIASEASEDGGKLASLGVTRFAGPISDMVSPGKFEVLPVPAPVAKTAPQSPLSAPMRDFPGRHSLSEREQQIVQLTVAGLSAKEAGRSLGLSYRTIEVHRSNIFTKLGIKNVAQLTRLVMSGDQ